MEWIDKDCVIVIFENKNGNMDNNTMLRISVDDLENDRDPYSWYDVPINFNNNEPLIWAGVEDAPSLLRDEDPNEFNNALKLVTNQAIYMYSKYPSLSVEKG
jgi:hypothetical protein